MTKSKPPKQRAGKKSKITKDTTLAEIMADPKLLPKLFALGIPCITCPLVGMEQSFLTLEAICKAYGLDLQKILTELNKTS